jgi:predicted DNA-binding transcriptional regulator AlpA
MTPHDRLSFDSRGDDLLTAEEVAAVLKIRPKEVYTLPLPAVRLSARRLRWTRSSLDQFISTHTERR